MSSTISQLATKHFRRNYTLGIANGAFFGFVDAIISPYLVLPLFVHGLGGSNFLIGLLPAIYNGGWFLPQFLISHRLQQLPRKKGVYIGAAVVRVICWAVLTLVTFGLANSDPRLLLAIFFILFTTYNLAAGTAGTPFMDIVAKTIPVDRRGSFFGGRDLYGAFAAIAGGYVVNLFLNPNRAPSFPLNFAYLFLINCIAVVIGLAAFALVVEPAETEAVSQVTFREQLGAARRLLRSNQVYQRYLWTRIVLAVADIASPFYAIYATTVLKAPPETIGSYIAIATVSSLLTNPLWSRLSDRRGNRILFLGAAAGMLAMPLIALLFGFLPSGPALGLPFGLLFLFAGIVRTAANIAAPSYLLEIAPALERPLYLGVTNSLLGIATFLPVIGGVLLDLAGFQIVFLLALLFSALGGWLAVGMAEPRRRA